jgi:hypothetical protein
MGRKTHDHSRRRKKDKQREKFNKGGKYSAKSIRITTALKEKIRCKRKKRKKESNIHKSI